VHASLSALRNRPERIEEWALDLAESIDLAFAAGEVKFETGLRQLSSYLKFCWPVMCTEAR